MKKTYILLAAALTFMSLVSCSNALGIDSAVDDGQVASVEGRLQVTGTIHKEAETRVSLADGGSSITPTWEVGDQVFGFYGENKLTYEVTSVADGMAELALANGTEPEDGTTVHMIYAPGNSVADIISQQLAIDLSVQDGTLEGLKNHAIMCATAAVKGTTLSFQFENQVAIVGVKQFSGLRANTNYTSASFTAFGPKAKVQVVDGVLKLVADDSYGTITATGNFASDDNGNTTETIYFAVPPHASSIPHTFDLNASDDRRTGTVSARAIAAGKYLYMTTKQMEKNTLVQHWTFDGNTKNSVPGGIDAVMSGTAPTLTTDRFGNENSAYHFAGTGGMLAPGAFEFGTSSFTANVWVCTTANGSGGHNILRTDNGFSGSNGCLLRFNNGKIEIWEGRSTGYEFISPYLYNNGVWHMLTYVRDVEARKGKLYVDGDFVGEYSISAAINNVTGPLSFGNVSQIEYYIGNIDDVRLYSKALTAKEVKDIYTPAVPEEAPSDNFSDYQTVEYIQTDKSAGVDIGIPCSSNLKAQFMYSQSGNIGGTIFGDYVSESDNFRFFATGGRFYFDCGNSSGSREYGGSMSANQIYNLEIGNHYIKNLDTDATIASSSSKSFVKPYNFCLFRNLGGASVKLYYMKIYDSGVLARDLVPCYNKAKPSIAGMFDKVNNVFYEITDATKGDDVVEQLTGIFSISPTGK